MKRDNKIKVCRILAVVFLCFWTISGVRVLAQNATSILDKAASAYEDSNGLTAYFTRHVRMCRKCRKALMVRSILKVINSY